MGLAVSDTANVIAAYVAELEAQRSALRLQTEAAEHSERECQRLSGLLKEEQKATKHQFALLQSLRVELREARHQLDEDDQLRTRLSTLLTGTANALKGEPPDLVWHDWSDLPAVAAKTVARLERTQAWLERFKGVAAEKGLALLHLQEMSAEPEDQSP